MLHNLKNRLTKFTDRETKSKKYLTVETNISICNSARYHIL